MPDVQVYQFTVSEILAETADEDDPDLTKIPAEYHEFAKVFSKEEADKLPEHCHYDHTIPLQEGTTPPFGPIYNLAPAELEVLRKYVDDNLRKQFIRHSQSPAAAPILFVKKPDGTLRLCVDYRGLNRITIKNRYPLPLVGEMVHEIRHAGWLQSPSGGPWRRMEDGFSLSLWALRIPSDALRSLQCSWHVPTLR